MLRPLRCQYCPDDSFSKPPSLSAMFTCPKEQKMFERVKHRINISILHQVRCFSFKIWRFMTCLWPSESFKKKSVVWKPPTFCPSFLTVDSVDSNSTRSLKWSKTNLKWDSLQLKPQAVRIFLKWKKKTLSACEAKGWKCSKEVTGGKSLSYKNLALFC